MLLAFMIWMLHEPRSTGKAGLYCIAHNNHKITDKIDCWWDNWYFRTKCKQFLLLLLQTVQRDLYSIMRENPFSVSVIAQNILKQSVSNALSVCQSIFWWSGLFSQTRHDTNYTGGKSIPTKHSAGTKQNKKYQSDWMFCLRQAAKSFCTLNLVFKPVK